MSQSLDNAVIVVPGDRLIFWSSVIFLPLSLLAAIYPVFVFWCLVVGACFCIFNVIDVSLSLSRFKDIQVSLPGLLRLSKEKPRSCKVMVLNEGMGLPFLKLNFFLPEEIVTLEKDLVIHELKEHSRNLLSWTLEGLILGKYEIKYCYLETVSVLGLWSVRARRDISSPISVYPNLISSQAQLASLYLSKNLGLHPRSMIGKGREFEQLREYMPGDNYDDIHWRATAKRNHPVTKTYQLERTQSIYLILDASRLSARRINAFTILEKYISAALMMGLVTARQKDHFGVLTFSNRVLNFIKAGSGQAHFNSVRDALFGLKPQIVSPDFSELFTFIGTRIRHRALLIFLTNLDDPLLSENFIQHVPVINKKHLVMVNTITPRGSGELFSTGSVHSTDDIYERLAGHLLWENSFKTKKILRSRNVDYSLFNEERLMVEMVSQYMNVKQRQIL